MQWPQQGLFGPHAGQLIGDEDRGVVLVPFLDRRVAVVQLELPQGLGRVGRGLDRVGAPAGDQRVDRPRVHLGDVARRDRGLGPRGPRGNVGDPFQIEGHAAIVGRTVGERNRDRPYPAAVPGRVRHDQAGDRLVGVRNRPRGDVLCYQFVAHNTKTSLIALVGAVRAPACHSYLFDLDRSRQVHVDVAARDRQDLQRLELNIDAITASPNGRAGLYYLLLSQEAHKNGIYATDEQINQVLSLCQWYL